jgi:hypothetical protein
VVNILGRSDPPTDKGSGVTEKRLGVEMGGAAKRGNRRGCMADPDA